jgi:hypothetical protein
MTEKLRELLDDPQNHAFGCAFSTDHLHEAPCDCWLRNAMPLLLDVVEAAEAVADFLRGTVIDWGDDSVMADQANIVIGLRRALQALDEGLAK